MRVIVPFDPTNPNTRLSPVLSADERVAFAEAMLTDVLTAVRAAGGVPEILATGPLGRDRDAPVSVETRGLSAAVNSALNGDTPAAVVMADLAIVTPGALGGLFDAAGDVVLAPGRGGGTNALVVHDDEFTVDYHGLSYTDHLEAAAAVGARVTTVDSFRLAVDIDDSTDLVEVLVHGTGESASWLQDTGFVVEVVDGQPTLARDSDR